MFGFVPRAAPR